MLALHNPVGRMLDLNRTLAGDSGAARPPLVDGLRRHFYAARQLARGTQMGHGAFEGGDFNLIFTIVRFHA